MGLFSSSSHGAPSTRTHLPSVEVIPAEDVESPQVQAVVSAWRKWRGLHHMPTHDQLTLRDLGASAKHISLARVLNDGDDYEFRIIGDAHVQAYGTSYQNRNLSDVIAAAPRFGKQLKAAYDLVRITRRAYAFRGTLGHDTPEAPFAWYETCYLPFGTGADVDHIVNAAVYQHRLTS